MLHRLYALAQKLGLTAVRCPVCGAATNAENGPFCPQCAWELMPRISGYCPQCGTIFGDESAPPTLCAECRHEPPPWETLHFHSAYRGVLRQLILNYKFNGVFGQTRLLAHLARQAYGKDAPPAPDAIVPVPLHPRRLLRRGFNQSLEISHSLGRDLDVPVLANGLKRTRHTRPQTRLGRSERQQNIKNAFAAQPDSISGKNILLVDDVYTTGSTIGECTRTLKQAGASSVSVLVLARAQEG